MPIKIVAAGHVALDITPVIKTGKSAGAFTPGKLVDTDTPEINLGGSMSNTGLAMDFFGADVTFLGKIGQDYFGDIALKILKEHNAHKDMIISEESYTSYTIIISPPDIDRTFLHGVGLNNTFCYNDIDFEKVKECQLFHFGYPNIMKALYENGGSEIIKIFKKVKSLGLMTSLDLAFADLESEAGKVDWVPILKELLPYVDFFVPSIEEIYAILERDKFCKLEKKSPKGNILPKLSITGDIMPLSNKLIEMGAKIVLIKCGALGMLLNVLGQHKPEQLGSNFASWAGFNKFEASFVPHKFLSSTGAGDTSIAAFLTSALMGYPPGKCLEYAAATGASCLTAYDSISGLISFEDIDNKIEKGWRKNCVEKI